MIRLSRDHLRQIADHGSAEYPNESCGLLVGHDESDGSITVSRIATSPNVAEQLGTGRRRDRFEVDPQLRINLEIELRGRPERPERPERIVGHFHSHPDHPAIPSGTDLERAFEPDLIWLITSIENGRAVATQAYRLDSGGGAFSEVEISIAGEET